MIEDSNLPTEKDKKMREQLTPIYDSTRFTRASWRRSMLRSMLLENTFVYYVTLIERLESFSSQNHVEVGLEEKATFKSCTHRPPPLEINLNNNKYNNYLLRRLQVRHRPWSLD
jgi:hypothetical protein